MSRRNRIDWVGAALLSAAIAAVLLAVTEANDWGWSSAQTIGLFAAGGLLFGMSNPDEAPGPAHEVDWPYLHEME